jgi:hypothetical protein
MTDQRSEQKLSATPREVGIWFTVLLLSGTLALWGWWTVDRLRATGWDWTAASLGPVIPALAVLLFALREALRLRRSRKKPARRVGSR